jgi:hypothetical protein
MRQPLMTEITDLDRLIDFIIRDYLMTCDENDRDFARHATTVFEYAQNFVNDGFMHIGGVKIRHTQELPKE